MSNIKKMKGKKCKKRNSFEKINKISWTKIMIGIYSAAIFSIFLISIGQDTSEIISIFNLKINFNYILCGIVLLFSTKYVFLPVK